MLTFLMQLTLPKKLLLVYPESHSVHEPPGQEAQFATGQLSAGAVITGVRGLATHASPASLGLDLESHSHSPLIGS